jgi:mono/diheme cytochrome c family protein
MRFTLLLAAALLATAPAFAQQAGGGAQPAPSGNAENGKKLFVATGCWQCHGLAGQGAPATGPRVANTAMPYQAFVQQLRKPVSDMPPYQAPILADQQAADIYAFLMSLPKPTDAKSIPLLSGS